MDHREVAGTAASENNSAIDAAIAQTGEARSVVGGIGIRLRLVALIAVAILPLTLLMVNDILSDFRNEIASTQARVQAAAELAASRHTKSFLEARIFLEALKNAPATLLAGGEECSATLVRFRETNPQFNSIGVVDRNETLVCHSSLSTPRRYANSVVFKRVSSSADDAFVVGDFIFGRATGRPTLSMAMAAGEAGSAGMVFVGYDLQNLFLSAEPGGLETGTVVSMLDRRSGRFITGDGNGGVRLTDPMPDHPFTVAIGNGRRGVTEVAGLDGVDRIYGYAPLAVTEAAGFVITVGVARTQALAHVYDDSLRAMATVLGVTLLTCLATWWLGAWTHLRPLGKLGEMARRLGGGDLDARVAIDSWQAPEFRSLARKLNRMAERLDESRRAEKAAAERDAIYKLLADNTVDVVARLDTVGMLTFVSPAALDVLGHRPEELVGSAAEAISVADDHGIVASLIANLQSGEAISDTRFRARRPEGSEVWIEVSARPLEGGGGVLVMRDITRRRIIEEELKEANARLEILAFNDALTGLTNRGAFDERFEAEFGRAVREKTDLGLILFDIDRFKNYNDTYGHPAGDECLRLVANVFKQCLRRPGDVGARYGGEEFIAILPNTSAEGVLDRAETIRQAIRSMGLGHTGSEFGIVTASLGVAAIPAGAGYRNAADMLKAVDRALYGAKSAGRDAVRAASDDPSPAASLCA